MGPQRDGSDDPPESEDSIEALLRATDRDTEEVVDALQDSGPRRHVSETSVDDVLTELSGPEAETSDNSFALSGGPNRTVSTSGIDEVFETLEDEAPALQPEPQADASAGSADDQSAADGSGTASTAMAANSASGGAAASSDRSDATPITFDRAGEEPPDTDGDEESFGALVGGEPTRTVSDASVDDILDSLDDDQAESASGTPSQEATDAADDLRPADPEGELVDLLAGEGAPSPNDEDSADEVAAVTDPGDRPDDAAGTDDFEDPADEAVGTDDPEDSADGATEADNAEGRADKIAEVDGAEGQTRVADAAAALSEHRSAGNTAADPDSSASGDDESFEWTDPEYDASGSESPKRADKPVATEADTVATGESRPLVSRAELEEIAAAVTNPESTSTGAPTSGSAAGTESAAGPDVGQPPESEPPAADRAASDEPVAATARRISAPTGPDAAASREAVTVDAVIAPTDASLGGATRAFDAGDEPDAVGHSEPGSGTAGGQSVDRSGLDRGPDASLVRRIGSLLRRFSDRMRR